VSGSIGLPFVFDAVRAGECIPARQATKAR